MRVVAVVPAWNASERLGACLDALAEQVEHTVVVDNGSTAEVSGSAFENFVTSAAAHGKDDFADADLKAD